MIGPIDHLFDFDNFPHQRRADQQLPAQHRRQPAHAARSGEPAAVRGGGRIPEQRLRPLQPGLRRRRPPVLRERHRGSHQHPPEHVQGAAVHRKGEPRLAGRTASTASSSAASSPGTTSSAYSHFLDDQIFSEAYIEKPVRWNAFVEDRLDLGDVVLVGGAAVRLVSQPGEPAGGLPGHQHPPGVREVRARLVLQRSEPVEAKTRATTTSARTSRCRSR